LKIADRPDRPIKENSRARRLVVMAGLLSVVGWSAWRIVSLTAATSLATADPDSALRWDRNAPAILAEAADLRLTDARTPQDLDEVASLARQALLASPLTQPALRQLGLIADLRGDLTAANRIMTIAGNASPFDAVSQVWLLDANLRRRDFADVVTRIDILFRTRPDLIDRLLPSIEPVILNDQGRAALVSRIQGNPPWREPLLASLARSADPTIAYSMLAALSSKTALTDPEIAPLVNRLVEAGNFQLGYLTWLQLAPDRAEQGLLSNGNFAHLPSGVPFDWVVTPINGAYTDIIPASDPAQGNELHVDFAHTRVDYANTAKLLLLKPGSYRFSGQVRIADLVAKEGIGWRIRCAEGDKQIIADTPHFSGTSPSREFGIQFTVPDNGCTAQWLTLQTLADLAVEKDIGGDIWFSHLAIHRDLGQDSSG